MRSDAQVCQCCGAEWKDMSEAPCWCERAGPCSCNGGARKFALWHRCAVHCGSCRVNDLDRMAKERERARIARNRARHKTRGRGTAKGKAARQ